MEGDLLIYIFFWFFVGGGVGYGIGGFKERRSEGFWLGACLGPIGWIITALLDYPLKCPECRGGVPENATRCLHCGIQLELVSALPSVKLPEQMIVRCPACDEQQQISADEQSLPRKCTKCRVGFVPKPSKRKH
jgi:hypothetical protein